MNMCQTVGNNSHCLFQTMQIVWAPLKVNKMIARLFLHGCAAETIGDENQIVYTQAVNVLT